MNRFQPVLVLGLLAGLLAPCGSDAFGKREPIGQVTVSKRAASLPGARYAWVEMPAVIAAEFDKRAQDPDLRRRLQAALDKALQAKGYARTDKMSEANVALAYRVGIRDTELSTVDDSALNSAGETAIECRGGDCSQIVTISADGPPEIKIDTEKLIEGGLMVEVLKPNEIRVLWRALYRGSVRAKDRGTVDLDSIATETLAQLPKAGANP